MDTPTHIYIGPRAAVIAETGCADFYPGKYLVAPIGRCNFIIDGCETQAETKVAVKQWKRQVPGIKVVWL